MTLRVTFEIVPYGEEEWKYPLGVLNIHNKEDYGFGKCIYKGTMEFVGQGKGELSETVSFDNLEHFRQHGFLELTKRAIERIDIEEIGD